MLTGDLRSPQSSRWAKGCPALEAIGLQAGTAVLPMLASPATDVTDALSSMGEASVEWKLDGVRIQAHRRRRRDPPVHPQPQRGHRAAAGRRRRCCAVARRVSWSSTARSSGCPRTACPMPSRTPCRASAGAPGAPQAMLSVGWFDCLHLDGRDLIDEPWPHGSTPWRRSTACTASRRCEPTTPTRRSGARRGVRHRSRGGDGQGARLAVRRGSPRASRGARSSPSTPSISWCWPSSGARGASGLAVQPPPGRARRRRHPVMVGKTFKGLTDEMLDVADRAVPRARDPSRRPHRVRPTRAGRRDRARRRPDIDAVPRGVALRFARVRRYRDDKSAAEADTLEAVRALLPRAHR